MIAAIAAAERLVAARSRGLHPVAVS